VLAVGSDGLFEALSDRGVETVTSGRIDAVIMGLLTDF